MVYQPAAILQWASFWLFNFRCYGCTPESVSQLWNPQGFVPFPCSVESHLDKHTVHLRWSPRLTLLQTHPALPLTKHKSSDMAYQTLAASAQHGTAGTVMPLQREAQLRLLNQNAPRRSDSRRVVLEQLRLSDSRGRSSDQSSICVSVGPVDCSNHKW